LAKGEDKFQKTLISSKDETDFIEGTVFEVSAEELLVADKYEPDNYQRIKVVLESGREAWIYIADEQYMKTSRFVIDFIKLK
jgi:Gamma-glutamyl cyclotransferase, AIG2-like